jgi:hypothetical protein
MQTKWLAPIESEQTISVKAAQQLHEEHYQNLNTIPEVLSLPSLFAQQEALHAIAGGADKFQYNY